MNYIIHSPKYFDQLANGFNAPPGFVLQEQNMIQSLLRIISCLMAPELIDSKPPFQKFSFILRQVLNLNFKDLF